MPRLWRPTEASGVHERGSADMFAPPERDESLGNECAVETVQRYYVGDRPKRNKMQKRAQIWLRASAGPKLAPPQLPCHSDHRQEHQPDRGKMSKAGEIIGTVRIHDGKSGRKSLVRLMMIDHDDLKPELCCFCEGFVAGHTAIDRDEKLYATLGKGTDGFDIRPISFKNSIRDVNDWIKPTMSKIPAEKRRGRCTVNVIVSKDRDAFPPDHGVGDAR